MSALLEQKIAALEQLAKQLEPGQKQRSALRKQAVAYGERFLEDIYTSPAYVPQNGQLALLDQLNVEDDPKSLPLLLDTMAKTVDLVGINPASEGHLGYIPGGGIYTSSLADYLADITNRYAGLYFGSPGAVKLENSLIRWTSELVGYPASALGNITSGGSIANLITITTARDAMQITPDKIHKTVIYHTQQTHHCVNKAVRIAGLGSAIMRSIPLDNLYRMNPILLRAQIESDKAAGLLPFYIAASCGSTDTGAVDELDKIADIAAENNVWFHVDAAYGGYFILVDKLKPLFKGIDRADSIVLDPHKSLFLPYGTGIALIKDGKALFQSQHYMASYLQDAYDGTEEVSPADLSPELTKHFRGLRLWLPLHLHGLAPFKAALEEKHLLTLYFHAKVQALGFEVGPTPQLSVGIYRFVSKKEDANAFNEKLVKAVQKDGRIFVSSTNIKGTYWIRIALLSFRTHKVTIDRYLGILEEKITELSV